MNIGSHLLVLLDVCVGHHAGDKPMARVLEEPLVAVVGEVMVDLVSECGYN